MGEPIQVLVKCQNVIGCGFLHQESWLIEAEGRSQLIDKITSFECPHCKGRVKIV